MNSALLFDPLFAGEKSKAQFTGPDMTAIANAASSAAVLFSWKTSGVSRFEDLKSKELVIGAMTKTGDTYIIPSAIKKILSLDNLKIVTGYPGTREAALALERGEISGRVWDMDGIRAARPHWLAEGSINILAQLARSKMPEVPADVPLIKDFIPNEDDQKVLDVIFLSTLIARPYIAPPNVPAARVRALRQAFMDTMKDPDFLAEAKRAGISINPMSGEEMERLVKDAYSLPDHVISRVRDVIAD